MIQAGTWATSLAVGADFAAVGFAFGGPIGGAVAGIVGGLIGAFVGYFSFSSWFR